MNDHAESPTPPLAPLFTALAKAQASFGPIERNRTVKVRPRKRDDGYQPPEYTFDYAPLEEVLSKCLPALNANGLSLFSVPDLCAGVLTTYLAHESGATIECRAPIPNSEWQGRGSAITYARRYTTQCLLGVAAEYDDDGNAADGNAAEPAPRRTQPTPPVPQQRQQRAPAQERKPEPAKAEPKPEPPAAAERPKSVPPPLPAKAQASTGPVTPGTMGKVKGLLVYLGLGSKLAATESGVKHMGKDHNHESFCEADAIKWLEGLTIEGLEKMGILLDAGVPPTEDQLNELSAECKKAQAARDAARAQPGAQA